MSLQLQAINLLSAYYRSVEELHLIDDDMVNVLSFYLEDHVHLAETIKLLDSDSSSVQLDNRHICLLKLRLFVVRC